MRIGDVTNKTYLAGLLRRVAEDRFECFDYCDWISVGGLDELKRKSNVYKPEWVEAVSKLRTDLNYLDENERCLTFSGKVRVFPNDVPQFAFTRRFFLPYIWLRPSEVHSLNLSFGSAVKIVAEEAQGVRSGFVWRRGGV